MPASELSEDDAVVCVGSLSPQKDCVWGGATAEEFRLLFLGVP